MTKHKMIRLFIPLLIVVCTALGLTGCVINGNVVGLSDYYYADSEKYSAGEAELSGTVENIDINWPVGSVTVLPHNANAVCLSEKSEREWAVDRQLHYWLDNTTLKIKYYGCGKWDLSELKKDLTVLVPDTLILSTLKVSSLSTNVKLSNLAVSQSVEVNTLSGELEAEFSLPLNEFKGDSTSGLIRVIAPSISRFNAEAISGAVNLSVSKEPDWLNVDTTSGDISLILPESASFTLDYDTTSGDLSSELSYRKSARKFIFGDGKGDYNISTVSGDVRITANAQEG